MQAVGIQCDGYDILGHDCYAISSAPTSSYPVTQSQKEPNYELYPAKKPEKKQKTALIIPPPTKNAPATPATVPPPVPIATQPQITKLLKAIPWTLSQPPSVPVPPPQPPNQNTADAWKENKKNEPTTKKTDHQDVEMQDAFKNKGGYHFMSMIQEMPEGDAIQS
jgi:hypothetical protein